jgi:hypothetical protein
MSSSLPFQLLQHLAPQPALTQVNRPLFPDGELHLQVCVLFFYVKVLKYVFKILIKMLILSKGGSISQTLLKANVQVLDNTACKLQYSTLTNNMICAAAPGKDTCQVSFKYLTLHFGLKILMISTLVV